MRYELQLAITWLLMFAIIDAIYHSGELVKGELTGSTILSLGVACVIGGSTGFLIGRRRVHRCTEEVENQILDFERKRLAQMRHSTSQ